MTAKDMFHSTVKTALIKEGWSITNDPLVVQLEGIDLFIDLGAEQVLAAQKENLLIAVEIKTFLGPSLISDFHLALGQFLNYRLALELQDPSRMLYLAVPVETYSTFFQRSFIQTAMKRYQLNVLVYDTKEKDIVQWIP